MAENIVVPLAPPAEAPKPNMFANWGQNGKGNWAKLDAESKKADAEFFDKKREAMGIANPNAPKQEIVTPYNPDVKVVPQQQVRNPQTRITGNPQNQPIRSTDDLARAMGYTSPEDEDRMRKASLTNQRILAIGDAIRQLGNIYHTVNYAPSQELTNPVEIEQQRYLQGKALRDRANQTYLDYQQAKAKQDAEAKRWQADFDYKQGLLQHYKDQEERLKAKDKAEQENKEARRDLDREKFEADKAYKEGRLSTAQYAAETARIRAVKSGRAGGGGSKYWAYDQEGNIHYYPNRTMWAQGVAQFGSNLDQTDTYTYTNAKGETTTREGRRAPASVGGELARKANGGGTSGGNRFGGTALGGNKGKEEKGGYKFNSFR